MKLIILSSLLSTAFAQIDKTAAQLLLPAADYTKCSAEGGCAKTLSKCCDWKKQNRWGFVELEDPLNGTYCSRVPDRYETFKTGDALMVQWGTLCYEKPWPKMSTLI